MARQGNHGIIWCDETWNPMRGCSSVSAGCDHCWAARMAMRHESNPRTPQFRGFARSGQWTGKVQLIESELERPLHWKKPMRIAVGLMGDLFRLPSADIDRVFAVMALCPQHTFLLLTKQARRMHEWSCRHVLNFVWKFPDAYSAHIFALLPNLHLGVSAEDQATREERVTWLLRTQAAHRWLSLEPLLGPVDLTDIGVHHANALTGDGYDGVHLDHVVVGGESGPGARPMHPDWVRKVRDQCQAAGVPFTFKQWGEWLPADQYGADGDKPSIATTGGARVIGIWPDGSSNGLKGADGYMEAYRVGKRNAGRLLDGRECNGEVEAEGER